MTRNTGKRSLLTLASLVKKEEEKTREKEKRKKKKHN
jgi:cell division protein YceG involved in septum cleavage